MTNKPRRILVVDDELSNIEVIAEIFGDDHEILFATEGEKALEIAATAQPDVILLDVMMPGMDGHETCRRLKMKHQTAGIPVIFITALGDVAAETRGLELGAMDYVTKPFSPAVVKMRVRNQIELKCAREQLTKLASTDGLTGLANRRRFDDVLTHEYARHARSGSELSLILLDIDHFKAYNDTYGHVSGDDCLRQVARVIDRVVVRATDLAARYGGEEFVCVLPETKRDGALAIAENIRQGIIALAIPHSGSSVAGHVTASLGVVTATCFPEKSPLNIVAQADEQLYKAKSGGRNRVEASANPGAPESITGNVAPLFWNASFRSGNSLIDQEHQHLFRTAGELSEAVLLPRPSNDIAAIATRMLRDVGLHFRDEERILAALGFPGLEQHAAEHRMLIDKGAALAREFEAGKLTAGEILEFLAFNVVTRHILVADREYFPLTNAPAAVGMI